MSASCAPSTPELGSLPTELLILIFTKVLERNVAHLMRLSKTCRRFREIILQDMIPKLIFQDEEDLRPSFLRSYCAQIDDWIAFGWFSYQINSWTLKSCSKMVRSFLVLNQPDLKNHVTPEYLRHIGDVDTHPDVYLMYQTWKEKNGVQFKVTDVSKNVIPAENFHQFRWIPHWDVMRFGAATCFRPAVMYLNLRDRTFGIHVRESLDPRVIYAQNTRPFKMYSHDAQVAFHGHVTWYHLHLNLLCLGTSNGRLYGFRIRELCDLYNLDLKQPVFMIQTKRYSAITRLEVAVVEQEVILHFEI